MRRALGTAALIAMLTAPSVLAAGPFEPNDSALSAVGPLGAQGYRSTIETASDHDFFYFYATSPGKTQVTLSVNNVGGGGEQSDIDATLLDAGGTPITSQAFIGDGGTAALAAELSPQKYYLEVNPGEGFGDSYELSVSTAVGTVGPYAQIEARCTGATAKAKAAQALLLRAQGKLQRATARLRRSRYATRDAKQRARSAHRQTKAMAKAARVALGKAKDFEELWCSIAP